METTLKQKLTNELLSNGFLKSDFNLKKVGGFLTLTVSELNKKSFTACLLAKKYFVNLEFNGVVYGIQSLEKELGYAFNN